MNKIGTVENIEGKNVTVRIIRDSSCSENCAMCNACPGKNMTVIINTNIKLSKGDTVKLETNTKHILLCAFIVYILPIVLLIIGYAVATLYIGLIFMLICFIILIFFDKKINAKHMIKLSKMH